MKRQLTTAVVAVALLAAGAAGAQPNQGNRGQGDRGRPEAPNSQGCYNGERSSDCGQRRRVEQQSHHHYVWRDGRYEDQDAGGAAVAGILGFMLGAAIAGSASDRDYYNSHRNDNGWRTRCRSTYSSFDYRTGTYLGRDGYRHYCTR